MDNLERRLNEDMGMQNNDMEMSGRSGGTNVMEEL